MPHDSWDNTLVLHRPPVQTRTRRPWFRWVAVGGGLAAVVALVFVAVAPIPGFVSPRSAGSPESSTSDDSAPQGPDIAATHAMPAPTTETATHPGGPPPVQRPTGSAPDDIAQPPSTRSDSTSPADDQGDEPLGPSVVVEAEAGTVVLAGSAAVTADPAASGGAYVGGVGFWGSGAPGVLVFPTVNLPSSGAWRLTIYFLDTGPNGPRTALVELSGATPQTIQFAGSPRCCGTRTMDAQLTAGPHSIVISNATAVGPSIDRLVLTLVSADQ